MFISFAFDSQSLQFFSEQDTAHILFAIHLTPVAIIIVYILSIDLTVGIDGIILLHKQLKDILLCEVAFGDIAEWNRIDSACG